MVTLPEGLGVSRASPVWLGPKALHGVFVPVHAGAGRIADDGCAICDHERVCHDGVPPVGVSSQCAVGVQQRSCALIPGHRWLETRMPFACASAAALIQPVTPPIFMTSGMTLSDAPASNACWRSWTPPRRDQVRPLIGVRPHTSLTCVSAFADRRPRATRVPLFARTSTLCQSAGPVSRPLRRETGQCQLGA